MELPASLRGDEASPEWLNKGDNAWQLTAATLVSLQSVPGLVIIYGSLVKKKWAVNSAFMALYAFAMVLVCWVGWGYRMSFGEEKFLPFVGRPGVALEQRYLLHHASQGYFPNATSVLFQFEFAAITTILIAGALLGRMNFHAWMIFVPLWLTFSYTISAYSIWYPEGWLAKLGVIDFSGGYVIHVASGIAGFTASYWVGPRMKTDRGVPPNNIILLLAGAGLLWMGWSGFNGGAPGPTNIIASLAVLNTHVCAATSLLTWLIWDIIFLGKPSVIGAIQGMITGLVCITPGAGLVQCWAAIIIGVIAGSIPWYTMMVLHGKIKFLQTVDDTMAVFHTHAVAGILGSILTGIFAEPKLNRLFFGVSNWKHYVGLAYAIEENRARDGFRQMGIQLLGILFVIVLNVVVTSVICLLIRLVLPLKLSEDELKIGDDAIRGEEAYALWDGGEHDTLGSQSSRPILYDQDPSVVQRPRSSAIGIL